MIWDVLVVTFSFSVFSSSLIFKALICFDSTLDTTWVFYFVDCLLLFLIFSQLSPQKNMYPWSVFSPSLLQVSALLWFLLNHETSRFFDSLIDSFCPWCFHNFHTRRICTLLHWNGDYVPLIPLFISFFLNTSNVLKLLLSSNCNSTLLDSFWSMFIICSVPLILKLLQYSFPTIIPHSCWTFISKIQFISVKNIWPSQYLTWRILQVGRTAERRTTKSGVF